MNLSMVYLVFALALAIAGCSLVVPKETSYLRTAADRATQEDVRTHMGVPRTVSALPNGESQWVYEIRDLEPFSQSSWSALGSWCDEYRLTFDRAGILRQWSHASYVHGGELMPVSCNGFVGVQKPAL
jgi:hypothetical protein